jgi:hypothetical protein
VATVSVRQYVYTSRLRAAPEDRAAVLAEIVTRARAANLRRGITGALLVAGDRVVQLVEGPPDAMEALVARLVADTRHAEVEPLHDGTADQRDAPDWQLALHALGDSDADVEELAALVSAFRNTFRFHLGDLVTIVHARLGATNPESTR